MTTEREIAARVDGVKQRLRTHVNMGRSGHLYSYQMIDHSGRVIGSIAKRTKNGGTDIEIEITMDDKTYSTFSAFRAAYEQKLRDEEWEAAAPKK